MNFADTITSWDDVTTDWISDTPIDATSTYIAIARALFERALDPLPSNGSIQSIRRMAEGTFKIKDRGVHVVGEYYNAGDTVQYNSDNYITNVSHTAETFRTSRTDLSFKVVPFTKDTVYEDAFENILVNTFTNTITADLINSGTTGIDVTEFWLVSSAEPFSYDEDMVDTYIYAKRPFTIPTQPEIKDIITPLYYEDNHTLSGNFELYPDELITIYGESEWHKSEAFGETNNDADYIQLEDIIRNFNTDFVWTEDDTTTNRLYLSEVGREERINSLYSQLTHMKHHKAPLIWDQSPIGDPIYELPSNTIKRGDVTFSYTHSPISSYDYSFEQNGYQLSYEVDGNIATLYTVLFSEKKKIGEVATGVPLTISIVKKDFYTTITVNSFNPIVLYTPFLFRILLDASELGGSPITINSESHSNWNNPATTFERSIRQVYSWENDIWYYEGQNTSVNFFDFGSDPNLPENTKQLPEDKDPSVTYTSPIFPRDAVVYIRKVVVTAEHGGDKVVTLNELTPHPVSAGSSLELIVEDFSEKEVWDQGNWYRYEYHEIEYYTYVHNFEDDPSAPTPPNLHINQGVTNIGDLIGHLPNYLGDEQKFFTARGSQYLRVASSSGDLSMGGLQYNQGIDCKHSATGTYEQEYQVQNTKTDRYYRRTISFKVHPGPLLEEIEFEFTQTQTHAVQRKSIGYWDCKLYNRQIARVDLKPYSESESYLTEIQQELANDYYGWYWRTNINPPRWSVDEGGREKPQMATISRKDSNRNGFDDDDAYDLQFDRQYFPWLLTPTGDWTQKGIITDIWGNKHFIEIEVDVIGLVLPSVFTTKADFYTNHSTLTDIDITWDGTIEESTLYGCWVAGGAGTFATPAKIVETEQGTPGVDGRQIYRRSYTEGVEDLQAIYEYNFNSFSFSNSYYGYFYSSKSRRKYWMSDVGNPVYPASFNKQRWTYNWNRFNFFGSIYSSTNSEGIPSTGQGGSKQRLGMHPLYPSSITYDYRDTSSAGIFDYGTVSLDLSETYQAPPDLFEDFYEIPFTAGNITFVPDNLGYDGITQIMGRLEWDGSRNWTVFRLTNIGSQSQKYNGIVYAYGNSATDPNPSQSFNWGSAGHQVTSQSPSSSIVAQVFNHMSQDEDEDAEYSTSIITVSRTSNPSYSFTGNKQPMVKLSARLISAIDPQSPPLTLNLFGQILNLPFGSVVVQDEDTGGNIDLGTGDDSIIMTGSEYASVTTVKISQIAFPSGENQADYIKHQKINTKDGYMQFWDAYEREEYWTFQPSLDPMYQIEIYQDPSGDYASWQEAYDDLINSYTVDPNEPAALLVWDKANLYEVTWRVQDEPL